MVGQQLQAWCYLSIQKLTRNAAKFGTISEKGKRYQERLRLIWFDYSYDLSCLSDILIHDRNVIWAIINCQISMLPSFYNSDFRIWQQPLWTLSDSLPSTGKQYLPAPTPLDHQLVGDIAHASLIKISSCLEDLPVTVPTCRHYLHERPLGLLHLNNILEPSQNTWRYTCMSLEQHPQLWPR